MGIAKIWDIIWDNGPFHWATAFVFIVAVTVECYTVWQYCSKTQGAIEVLSKLEKVKNATPSDKYRIWFKKHLGTDEPSKFSKEGKKFLLIKYPSVLARPIPRSSLRFVTTLCTAIGVLGTFYGIQDGLQGINLSSINNSSELMEASTGLLEGMKTAFSTSLMGLGSGSLFTLVLFISDSLKQKRRDSLRHRLEKIATLPTTDNTNAELVPILSRLADQFTGLNQLSAEAIGQAVGQQMRTLILPGMQAIFKEQQQLRELQQNQGQRVLEELIKDLRVEVLEPIAVRLDKSAELTQQASDAVLTLHKELGGISQSLANSILTIQNFQQQTLVELQGFANNLGETLSQFQTDTKGVLQLTSQEINRAVEQSIQGMTAQRSAFEASAEQAAATFRGIREELQTALQERARVEQEILQATRTGIIQILTQANRAFQDQTNTLQTVGNEASILMNDAKNNLLATLGHIDTTLTATRETVQNDLTKFREEYQTNLHKFFTEQNNLLEGTLGEQRDGLARVVTNLDRVFQEEAQRRIQLTQEVDRSMTQIRQAAREVGELVTAVGLNSSQRLIQLEELAHGIGEQVQGVRREYRELSNSFRDSLIAWQNHFDKSQMQFFNEADSSMAKVCGGLLETAKVLIAANDSNKIINGRNYHG
ncbi:hypothetical protein H6G33_18630 [Calothrix sp. FACHB-1219]|uniref:hypothetical protein n=1 Tax=unclassified Calothrix TaxID=2619626 RepID=UPI0016827F7A|nr:MULTISPECIES: hypothetical protein [unclassified Calothrix]MBD2203448.1 hypothetical protein [Calothrix sp. FACHB-168]MBD2219040.1 hypothetical protein [Calothrix sp. FACHB-1219]